MNNASRRILFSSAAGRRTGVWHLLYQEIFLPNCLASEVGEGQQGIVIVHLLLALFCSPNKQQTSMFSYWFNLITQFLCD